MPVASIKKLKPSSEYDVIVIGSGAAGLSTALSAAQQGLRVAVMEKSSVIGGTTAWSGGWMWLPQNPYAKKAGIEDSKEEVKRYLTSVAKGNELDPREDIFLDAAPKMVEHYRSTEGSLNEVYLLRGFSSLEEMYEERDLIRLSSDPFNGGENLLHYSCDSYKALDFMPEIESGEFGKVYEIRTYQPTLNGLAPTIEKWRETVPKREVYSPLTIAMYSIDGPTRFTQIWPYESANARAEARGKSVAGGVWPPAGGPAFLRPDGINNGDSNAILTFAASL